MGVKSHGSFPGSRAWSLIAYLQRIGWSLFLFTFFLAGCAQPALRQWFPLFLGEPRILGRQSKQWWRSGWQPPELGQRVFRRLEWWQLPQLGRLGR